MERTATAPLWVRSSEVVVVVSKAAMAWGGSSSISVDAIFSREEQGPWVMGRNLEQLQNSKLHAAEFLDFRARILTYARFRPLILA